MGNGAIDTPHKAEEAVDQLYQLFEEEKEKSVLKGERRRIIAEIEAKHQAKIKGLKKIVEEV